MTGVCKLMLKSASPKWLPLRPFFLFCVSLHAKKTPSHQRKKHKELTDEDLFTVLSENLAVSVDMKLPKGTYDGLGLKYGVSYSTIKCIWNRRDKDGDMQHVGKSTRRNRVGRYGRKRVDIAKTNEKLILLLYDFVILSYMHQL